ncbi:hypothetical protein HPP92_019030 [Vanilla planifolia]|uniref:NAC domain-containing protein n=1 Tax=Vanilla planifolia TaxID=51239 RepID=A0A835Q6U2_VANPL|nr:hypothetical protein HPP92_019030 [Vanilla planifolia]
MDEQLYLPPGFRFHPTDEEIILHYLLEKIVDRNFSCFAISEANFNYSEPWELPSKAKMGENEWYFFCQKDRKYPTGMRTNRATEAGYWKATGKDKEILERQGVLIGMKKTLVFYQGRAPRGQKTNWIMNEYRLEGKQQEFFNLSTPLKGEWVVCKVYHKAKDSKMSSPQDLATKLNAFVEDLLVEPSTLPPLMDSPYLNSSSKEYETQIHPLLHFSSQEGISALRDSTMSISQETGLSTDRKAEASPAISGHHMSNLQSMEFDGMLNYKSM